MLKDAAPESEGGSTARPTIAVTLGDPGGIGPEVIAAALTDPAVRGGARWVIFGSRSAMHAGAEACGVEPFWWSASTLKVLMSAAEAHEVLLLDFDESIAPTAGEWRRESTAVGGAASFAYLEAALSDVSWVDALVTGPISKEAWALAGRGRWAGHTELLADRLGARRYRMMFVSPELWVTLATTHIPLMRVVDELTLGRVLETIELCHETCTMLEGRAPRIAVCGLNPHAGEHGLMGADESRVIEPAISHAKRLGINAAGPFPGDTIFGAARRSDPRRRFDAVVAMYHDQGLIPVKLLGFDRAVNLTPGLPLPRTSPDHGTAFDIAGRGVADPGSMREALRMAVRLASFGRLASEGIAR